MSRKACHKPTNTWGARYDAEIAERPPDIVWKRNTRGIWVAIYVDDPHVNGGDRNADKTHCKYGHEFTPENTLRKPDGGRQCRTCKRGWNRAGYAARKGAAA